MKRSIIMYAAALASTATFDVNAQEHANYPINYAKCDYIVSEPEGSGGFKYSQDCKTVYVLPPKKGTFVANTAPNWRLLDSLCPIFYSRLETLRKKQNKIDEFESAKLALDPTNASEAKKIAILQEHIDALSTDIESLKDNMGKVEGGSAKVDVMAKSDDLVKEFYARNQNLVYQNQVKFEAMPIQSGYLTFTDYKAGPDILFPAVKDILGGGVKVIAETTGQTLYKMIDSMSGQMILGINKACQLHDQYLKAATKSTTLSEHEINQLLKSELAPIYSYSYYTMSTVSYEAKLNFKRAAEVFLSRDEFKSQFTVGQVVDVLTELDAGDILKFNLNLGELGDRFSSEADRMKFAADLREDVMSRLSMKFLRELESLNAVEIESVSADLTVPEPGHRKEVAGVQNICEKKSFAGIRYKKKCRDQTVFRHIPVNGELNDQETNVFNLDISVEESLQLNENILSAGITSF